MDAMTPDQPRKLTSIQKAWLGLRARLGPKNGDPSLRQSLSDVIDEHETGVTVGEPSDLGLDEREMLRNLLQYGELRVDDVAVPRADIIAFEASDSFADLVRLFAEAGHSRLPVYRETLDGIIGLVHIKDVYAFLADPEKPRPRVDAMLRPVLFVPPAMRVMDLLARMRAGRTHMAIVVDEYGGVDGLVTIEDLVEEIVGDIEDEHDDADEVQLKALGPNLFEADARLLLEELETELGLDFLPDDEDAEIDTLGGLVFMLAGHVPVIGEMLEHPTGVRFEIVDGDARRVTRLRLHLPASPGDPPTAPA
jgi:CBS domain containing-hemolysin-like protein